MYRRASLTRRVLLWLEEHSGPALQTPVNLDLTSMNSSIEEAIAHTLDAHAEISFAYLHGSFVHGPQARDIDIAVYLKPDRIPDATFAYEDSLAQEITSKAGPSVPADVRVMNNTPIPFQYHVLKGKLLVDHDPDDRLELMSFIISRYLDMKPLLEHHLKEAFGHGA